MHSKSLQNTFYLIAILLGVGWLLYLGTSIIQPILFALLFALFLFPIHKRVIKLKFIKWEWLAILITFAIVLIPIFFIGLYVSFQLVEIAESLPTIGDNLVAGFQKILDRISSLLPSRNLKAEELFSDNIQAIIKGPLGLVGKGIVSSSEFLVSFALTFLYTFFFLYYRKAFRNFTIYQFKKTKRPEVRKVLSKIKSTVQAYVGGLALVMLLLAVLNSIGLYFIGIEYPLFWGTLGGLLAVIPYIGTILGGLLPFLFALATTDTTWQPAILIVFYVFIQQIEGNIITPKIIGSQVNINPLVAILALVIFGSFWGIGGVILALPMVSILRIILLQFTATEDIGMLMGADLAKNPDKFGN